MMSDGASEKVMDQNFQARMPPAIAFENVGKAYPGATGKALDRVSLVVDEREFLAVVGASGSGKSTLLALVNRLTDASEGVVRFQGEDVRAMDPVALRRRIGFVFQGVGLFPHMSVAENIGVTPRLLGWDGARVAARVDVLLDLLQLPPAAFRSRLPRQLSGGESQRVGVARAIAAEPSVVLMDEPFGALDPLVRDEIAQEYRRIHEHLGLTTVMITHDVLEAVLLADHIAVLQDGRLVEHGPPRVLMSEPRSPYTRDLMQTPRRQGNRLHALMQGGQEDGQEGRNA
jgi:osmoprotectant transport system ATP-binding protein